MSKIVRWETPFTDAFYPSVVLIATPSPLLSKKGVNVKAIVAPSGIDKYPKYSVDFGEVIVFVSMDESCCPRRDFDSVIFDETLKGDKELSAFQWFDSPWLKSYEACFDPYATGKFFHFLIYGGDNNVEVITQNIPKIELVKGPEILRMECEV
jgi:hypothetical protein